MYYYFPNFIGMMFVMAGLLVVAVVQVLLIGLKLFGVLALSWWWVLSVIPICFVLLVVGTGLVSILGVPRWLE